MRMPIRCWSRCRLLLKIVIFLLFFTFFIRLNNHHQASKSNNLGLTKLGPLEEVAILEHNQNPSRHKLQNQEEYDHEKISKEVINNNDNINNNNNINNNIDNNNNINNKIHSNNNNNNINNKIDNNNNNINNNIDNNINTNINNDNKDGIIKDVGKSKTENHKEAIQSLNNDHAPTTTAPFNIFESTLTNPELVFDNTWRPTEPNKDVYSYSAFYDTRVTPTVIRIVAIIHKKFRVKTCTLWGSNNKTQIVSAKTVVIKENWNLKYVCGFIVCDVPVKAFIGLPQYVSPDSNDRNKAAIKIEYFDQPKIGNLSVCVKSFHYDYDRALWLVEFIEMYRLLGVDHFFFYNHTVGSNVQKVLQYYVKEGTVSVLTWNLPVKSQKEIRTEGIFAALNDCNLRSVGRFTFAANVDFDEFLIPRNHSTLIDLLSESPDHFYYSFQNVFYYLYWGNDTAGVDQLFYKGDPSLGEKLFGSEDNMPYLLTVSKTRRLTNPHRHSQRSKYIIRPERVTELGNHNIWAWVGTKKVKLFNSKEALSHHYRICEFGGFDCLKGKNQLDRSAHRWLVPLVKRVANSCSEIFEGNPACPPAPPLGSPW